MIGGNRIVNVESAAVGCTRLDQKLRVYGLIPEERDGHLSDHMLFLRFV